MTPERWRQVSRVYGAVLTKAPDARGGALAELCGGDDDLRREVESLLADDSGAALVDRPVAAVAASLVARDLRGQTFGPYRLDAMIGAGGMGQVYRASDTRLQRTVAVKVLASSIAHDPQFRARFEREARTIAALNHPHICTLFDVGASDGIDYLVMEYVEGETLAMRLERGPLPLNGTLSFAVQIAEALAAAHRRGIVHRDLKPGNVMLTKSGVKLLDFGLAKATQGATIASTLSMLPTTPPMDKAAPPLTAQGTILGTLQYMAPEQLEGKEADARSDIFAFGAIVYEMLTGKKAFGGATQASVIGAIMHGEPPPMTAGQPLTPPALERIVRACLAKDPDARWQSAADLARELRPIDQTPTAAPSDATRRAWSTRGLAIAAVVAAAVGVMGGVAGFRLRPAAAERVVRFNIAAPPGGFFTPNPGGAAPAISLSPDGRWIAYGAWDPASGQQRLWVRDVADVAARPLPGTEGVRYPFWSPDSRSLGFMTQVALKRVDVAGGTAREIADIGDCSGATWLPSSVIVVGTLSRGLMTIGDEGGRVSELHLRGDSGFGRLPIALPDGRHFLYWDRQGETSDGAIRVGSLDGDSEPIVSTVRGVGLSLHHLLFVRGQTLFAQPFDEASRKTTGPAVAIADDVATSSTTGYAAFAAATQSATIVTAKSLVSTRQSRWIRRSGERLAAVSGVMVESGLRLASDERHFLLVRPEPAAGFNAIWAYDQTRRSESKVVPGGTPVFSPDGQWIAFIRMPNASGMARIRSDGSGEIDTLLPRIAWPTDWSSDGRKLLIQTPESETGIDVSIFDLETRVVTPLVHTSANESEGCFSPDQTLIAYVSDESGRPEVWVKSLASGQRLQVSDAPGGSDPRWRKDGKASELFYLSNDQKVAMVTVSVDTAGQVTATPAVRLFDVNLPFRVPFFGLDFEPSADGQRFLVNEFSGMPDPPTLTAIVNWRDLLKGQP